MLPLILVGFSLFSLTLGYAIRSETDDPDDLGDWCGTTETPTELQRIYGQRVPFMRRQGNNQTSIIVKTHFHVITNSSRLEDGALTDQMLGDQLRVLNEDYNKTRISFVLEGTYRLVDTTWATSVDDTDHLAMKTTLRKGDYKTLNIYFRTVVGESSTGSGLFGNCFLPRKVTAGSKQFYQDGCQVLHGTVPGSTISGSNLGKTATHEVGHWLGLSHTFDKHEFEDGCQGPGDYVDDTPREANAARGCPMGRNTCDGDELFDPIHNHMDYSAQNEFTPGQTARMHGAWNDFRL